MCIRDRLQIGIGMLPIKTSTSDEPFSRINIDNFEKPWISNIRGFYWYLRPSAAAHTPRMNCGEMAGDRLTVCVQELLQAFARLVSISSNFLYLYRMYSNFCLDEVFVSYCCNGFLLSNVLCNWVIWVGWSSCEKRGIKFINSVVVAKKITPCSENLY